MSQLTLFTCAPDPFEALETAGRFLSSAATGIATFHQRRKIVDLDHRERSITDVMYLRQYHAHNDVDNLALDNLHAVVQMSRLGFKLFTDQQWNEESSRRIRQRRAEQEAQRRRERDAEAAAMHEAARIYRERMTARERVRSEAMGSVPIESMLQPTGSYRMVDNGDGTARRESIRAARWVIVTRDDRSGDTISREVEITDEQMYVFQHEAAFGGIPLERVIEQFYADGHDIRDRQIREREQRALYGTLGQYSQRDIEQTRAAQNFFVQAEGVPTGRSVFDDPGPLTGAPGPSLSPQEAEYRATRTRNFAAMYGATGESRARVGVVGDSHVEGSGGPFGDDAWRGAAEALAGSLGDVVPTEGGATGDESSPITRAHIERIQRIGARMDREVAEMMSNPVPVTVNREPTGGSFTIHGARTSRMSGGGGLNASAMPRSQAENRIHRVGGTPPVIIDYEALPDDATLLDNVRRMRQVRTVPNDRRYTLTSRVSVNEAEFTNQTLGEPWRPESPTGRTPSEPNTQRITRPILNNNGEPATLMGYPLVTEIGPDE